jgi:hypothetical protein
MNKKHWIKTHKLLITFGILCILELGIIIWLFLNLTPIYIQGYNAGILNLIYKQTAETTCYISNNSTIVPLNFTSIIK